MVSPIFDNFIDGIYASMRSLAELAFGSDPQELIDIVTVDDESTLICKGGAFLSVIEIEGSASIIGNVEYGKIIEELNNILKTRLSSGAGHKIRVVADVDPDTVEVNMGNMLRGAREQGRRMGINVDDLLDEKIEINRQYCQTEKVVLCFYTTINVLPAEGIKKTRGAL